MFILITEYYICYPWLNDSAIDNKVVSHLPIIHIYWYAKYTLYTIILISNLFNLTFSRCWQVTVIDIFWKFSMLQTIHITFNTYHYPNRVQHNEEGVSEARNNLYK